MKGAGHDILMFCPCSLEFLSLVVWGKCFDLEMFGELSLTLRFGPHNNDRSPET